MTRSEAGKLGAQAAKRVQHEKLQERKAAYYEKPILCIQCGAPIAYDGLSKKRRSLRKFCSMRCRTMYQTQPKVKIYGTCLYCGKPITTKAGNKFCSVKCSSSYNRQQLYATFESTGEFPARFQGEVERRTVREYLIQKFGRKCSICGCTEWMGQPIPVVVDHIDGDALNRKINNFRLVCPNCDAQLPTYKSKNRHGRKWRHRYA